MSQPDTNGNLEIECLNSLSSIPPLEWNALTKQNPFISHGFLRNLEVSNCLEPHGWFPYHLIVKRDNKIIAALPTYARDNSYGEFVFDWSWADAYERAGGKYYPKLVSASPFSPVTGPRLLIDSSQEESFDAKKIILKTIDNICRSNGLSSWHMLFFEPSELDFYKKEGLLIRQGCQYHWENHGFQNFTEFLTSLSSKRRKAIKRERNKLRDSQIKIEIREGRDIEEMHWDVFHSFYCSTFQKKWSQPRLTKEFFLNLVNLDEFKPILFLAKDGNHYVAGAFALSSEDCLYGRHWGANSYHEYLHFELCYYQTIEYCIRHKIKKLDAGAQGEHKLKRGFHPVKTFSAHHIIDKNFKMAISKFLVQETEAVDNYINSL